MLGTQKGLVFFALVFLGHALEIAEELVMPNLYPPLETLFRNRLIELVNAA